MPPRPAPRQILDAGEAETYAVKWVEYLGFRNARRSPIGRDHGIDVEAEGAVAQVKWYVNSAPVRAAAVRELAGVASIRARHSRQETVGIFFAIRYTEDAIAVGKSAVLALYQFTDDGVAPLTRVAEDLLRQAGKPWLSRLGRAFKRGSVPDRALRRDSAAPKRSEAERDSLRTLPLPPEVPWDFPDVPPPRND